MSIRDAKPSDAACLAALSIEVWVGTYLRRGVGAVFADYVLGAYTTAQMRALILDPAQIIAVSDNEEGPDGYVRVSSEFDPPLPECRGAEIVTLYVQPRHQGRGVGRSLLNDALARCRANGIGSVWLTTNAENAQAIAFYHRMGFQTVGRTDFVINGVGYPNEVFCLDLTNADSRDKIAVEPPRTALDRS